jgi:Uncharacterized protein conserved in bacteria (DUF2330)
MRTLIASLPAIVALMGASLLHDPSSADACAGLIGSNGAVNLGRTTTLAAYHGGVEHYVTAFEFQGGGGQFGSLIPLPGVPTNVERGGDWTLQRLQKEVPQQAVGVGGPASGTGTGAGGGVSVLQEVRIDALDLTVLSGGGPDVAVWAEEHGFRLSPDAPEVLDFYASRSPVFLAAVFDSAAAAERGQTFGDGTPVHITIPTDNPWVPLRILGLGKQADDFIQADVFLLTDGGPEFLPAVGNGLFLTYYGQATDLLLDDLRSDAGMGWIPESAWLTKLQVLSRAADLRYDLAVDASGEGMPSLMRTGVFALRNADSSPSSLPDTGDSPSSESDGWFEVTVFAASTLIAVAFAVWRLRRTRNDRLGA